MAGVVESAVRCVVLLGILLLVVRQSMSGVYVLVGCCTFSLAHCCKQLLAVAVVPCACSALARFDQVCLAYTPAPDDDDDDGDASIIIMGAVLSCGTFRPCVVSICFNLSPASMQSTLLLFNSPPVTLVTGTCALGVLLLQIVTGS